MGEAAVGQRAPEEIRRDIDATRADLSSTIDQIEDRVSPSRIASRSGDRMRTRWQRTREAVMGSAQEGRQRLSQSSGSGGQRMEQAEEAIERNVRGNPLAAGLIAFGAGALAASLLPSSRTEQRLAHSVREQAEPMVRGELQSTGKEIGQHLSEEAKQAAQETAESAKWAAQTTMEDAKEAASATGDHARNAARSTGEQAKDAAQQTKQAGQSGQG